MCIRSGSDVLMRPNASSGVPVSQVAAFLFRREKHRTALVVDRAGKRVGQRRHEREHLDVDVGPVLLDRAFPLPVDAGEGEQRARLVSLQREPVPFRRLALVGLAERRRRHQAAPLLKAVLPELGLALSSRVLVTRLGA